MLKISFGSSQTTHWIVQFDIQLEVSFRDRIFELDPPPF